jgi:hypothetical protein
MRLGRLAAPDCCEFNVLKQDDSWEGKRLRRKAGSHQAAVIRDRKLAALAIGCWLRSFGGPHGSRRMVAAIAVGRWLRSFGAPDGRG